MSVRFCAVLALGLGLLPACGDDGTGPGSVNAKGNGQSATLLGTVVTLRFQPDSSYVPVAGATVRVYLIGGLPSDSTAPPDSSGLVPLMGFPGFPPAADSLPGDSTLPPPPPVDTVPPDTTPPPPPLPGCGERGELVASVVTNPQGGFTAPRLTPGRYDLVAEAPDGLHFDGLLCDLALRGGATREVTIFVPFAPDMLTARRP